MIFLKNFRTESLGRPYPPVDHNAAYSEYEEGRYECYGRSGHWNQTPMRLIA